jgi:hypothetical protein
VDFTGVSGAAGKAVTANGLINSGAGGNTPLGFGIGGPIVWNQTTANNSGNAGFAGSGYGSGGSGACTSSNGGGLTSWAGGAGTNGIVIVYEYK